MGDITLYLDAAGNEQEGEMIDDRRNGDLLEQFP